MEPAAAQELSDAELMQALGQGDMASLGVLYERYGERVRDLLYRLNLERPRSEVDDLCQDVFLQAYSSAGRYRHEGKLLSWLYGIAARLTRSQRRKRWLRAKLLHQEQQDPTTILVPCSDASSLSAQQLEQRQELDWALAQIKPVLRDVLILHVIEGLSGKEIAAVVGVGQSAVWMRLSRARQKLRGLLVLRRTQENEHEALP